MQPWACWSRVVHAGRRSWHLLAVCTWILMHPPICPHQSIMRSMGFSSMERPYLLTADLDDAAPCVARHTASSEAPERHVDVLVKRQNALICI